jgi:biopolymer transport protein ExbB/TolQ
LNYYAGSSEIETSEGAEDWLSEHFNLAGKISDEESVKGDALHARLVERVHRGHSLGWYIVDVLIRLGLIGTVIGFIMMLGAVYRLNDEDVTVLQDLLGSMGAGMQVALYTTLTGISASLVLSIYCKALDRFADDLISNVIKLTVNTASEKTIVKPV